MTDETSTPASEPTPSKTKQQPRKDKPTTRCPVCTEQLKHTPWQAPRLNDGRCSHCGYQNR